MATKPAAIPGYPFAAIVAQEGMKLALLLSVVEPRIGGVIIMGHRGTGKSTAVRSLAELLPPINRVKGCHYGCDPSTVAELCDDCRARHSRGRLPGLEAQAPVVDLPLGATEDRVCGALNIEQALSKGVKTFEPGLLARANRGFLYIDEVNLLDDHLVDVLLDAAASGRNIVEREGISANHPARFVLVGSGNPEEGELRPQLLDRFGLYAEISTIMDLNQRVEIVERRDRFERDPFAFAAEWAGAQRALREQVVRAKAIFDSVVVERTLMLGIAELCSSLGVSGHRGELTITRAARALAALAARLAVTVEDVRQVAVLALRHRLRKGPLERTESAFRIEEALERIMPKGDSGTKLAIVM
ncbi:MAG TPA: magnesium chelatase ATPase subunit I [Blastocatellia bacterium]